MTDPIRNMMKMEEMAVANQMNKFSSQVKALRSVNEKKEHHLKQELHRSK